MDRAGPARRGDPPGPGRAGGSWGLVNRVGLLQQCKLPIGDLSDGVRQRCGQRRKPLAAPPAIPDVVAEQVGASRHGRVTSVAFLDLLLDQDSLLDGGEVADRI